jgi:Flp pilus assembly pilin Flp
MAQPSGLESVCPNAGFLQSLYNSGEMKMKQLVVRLWKEEEAQDLTEYALLLVLLTLAAVTTLGGLATAINGVFINVATNLTTPT